MTPTMYLRQVPNNLPIIEHGVNLDGAQVEQSIVRVTGYRLQQWWYDARPARGVRGELASLDNASEPHFGYGQWRDVPIVGEV